jgi:hypothetical protein
MQLTIKVSGKNAWVVSHLLAKNPNSIYERDEKGHLVRMFYSKYSEQELEATIFVTPNISSLNRKVSNINKIEGHINDRGFVVSSIFCTLIRPALGTALNGQPHEEYTKWVNYEFPFEFSFGPVSTNLKDEQIIDLFEPLGFHVSMDTGSARFISIEGKTTLQMAVRQIFILIPVLDNYKHFYIDLKEVEKLERYGDKWLHTHPKKGLIIRRFLRYKEIYNQYKSEDAL